MKGHDFSWALRKLKSGKKVKRKAWTLFEYTYLNDKQEFLDHYSDGSDTHCYFSEPAILAEDWEVVE
jgi:hypothetical protein